MLLYCNLAYIYNFHYTVSIVLIINDTSYCIWNLYIIFFLYFNYIDYLHITCIILFWLFLYPCGNGLVNEFMESEINWIELNWIKFDGRHNSPSPLFFQEWRSSWNALFLTNYRRSTCIGSFWKQATVHMNKHKFHKCLQVLVRAVSFTKIHPITSVVFTFMPKIISSYSNVIMFWVVTICKAHLSIQLMEQVGSSSKSEHFLPHHGVTAQKSIIFIHCHKNPQLSQAPVCERHTEQF